MMESLETSRVCRLCGQQSGNCVDIFDGGENHARKINAILPILVHEMDLLPKHMCHRCSYKLEDFHKFYMDSMKTDTQLKRQLSWMRQEESEHNDGVPMVQIENIRIKTEPPDYDIYDRDPVVDNVNYLNSMSTMTTLPVNNVGNNRTIPNTFSKVRKKFSNANVKHNGRCNCDCDKRDSAKGAISKGSMRLRSWQNSVKSPGFTNVGSPGRINTLKNIIANDTLKDMRKRILANGRLKETRGSVPRNHSTKDTRRSKLCLPKEICSLNTDNILNSSEVKVIEIQTEKSDDVEIRSLRPRKNSVNYVGTKRGSSSRSGTNLQGSRSKSADSRPILPHPVDLSLTEDVRVEIKVERLDEVETRSLRPRKNSVDYLGTRRNTSSEIQRSRSEEGRKKRHKASIEIASSESCKPVPKATDLVIKQEMPSDLLDSNCEREMFTKRTGKATRRNGVRNLTESFDILPKNVMVKIEKVIESIPIENNRTSSSSSKSKVKSQTFRKTLRNKLKSDEVGSLKHLRSRNIPLRNGKVKKSDSLHLSIKDLKGRLKKLGAKKGAVGKTISKQINENGNLRKVSAGVLKIVNSIKHFCEKCNSTFMNNELYKLHACY